MFQAGSIGSHEVGRRSLTGDRVEPVIVRQPAFGRGEHVTGEEPRSEIVPWMMPRVVIGQICATRNLKGQSVR
jgi:hypothetical protein